MSHLQLTANGHLLKLANGHLAKECCCCGAAMPSDCSAYSDTMIVTIPVDAELASLTGLTVGTDIVVTVRRQYADYVACMGCHYYGCITANGHKIYIDIGYGGQSGFNFGCDQWAVQIRIDDGYAYDGLCKTCSTNSPVGNYITNYPSYHSTTATVAAGSPFFSCSSTCPTSDYSGSRVVDFDSGNAFVLGDSCYIDALFPLTVNNQGGNSWRGTTYCNYNGRRTDTEAVITCSCGIWFVRISVGIGSQTNVWTFYFALCATGDPAGSYTHIEGGDDGGCATSPPTMTCVVS